MNATIKLFVLTLISLVFCQTSTAQSMSIGSLQQAHTKYKLQVRMDSESARVVLLSQGSLQAERTNRYFLELESWQSAQDVANSSYLASTIVGEYETDPAAGKWVTVSVEDSYSEAVDVWYEIVDGASDEMDVRIQSFASGMSYNLSTQIGTGSSTSSSTSLADYYYDYRVKLRTSQTSTGYLVDTGRTNNRYIVRNYSNSYAINSYLASHPNYRLVESRNYFGVDSSFETVATARTFAEAEELIDFIKDQNANQLLGDSNFTVQAFWAR